MDDDAPIGRVLGRREVLALLGGTGGALLAACVPGAPVAASPSPVATAAPSGPPVTTSGGATAVPSCVARPALTDGPYFVDEKLQRSDIRADPSDGSVRPGALLTLTFNVSRLTSGSCAALQNAMVDVWHCDALGVYSDVADPSGGTKGTKFLRGYQLTDASGRARFVTIYPGWYPGRAVHIHFKIRTTAPTGQVSDLTSQLFFDDDLSDRVFAQRPYSQKAGRRTRNADDGIFRGGGDRLLLDVTPSGDGFAATFDIGLAS